MNEWFTVEEIDAQTFAISEYQHWEETHCYLLCGQNIAALIDTGLGVSNIKRVVDHLTTLPVTVLTTHVHWDHIGGHGLFDRIAVHEAEKDWIDGSFPLPLEAVKEQLTKLPCAFPDEFDLDAYRLFQGEPQLLMRDGNCFDQGGRTIRVLHTPGHSPGHCCFYELERRYLYSGDLIYKGCLDAFYPSIAVRYYQEAAIKAVCDSFGRKNRRKALLVMATGSGKTRTVIALVKVLLEQGWIKNVLFLADRNSLVTQAKRSFVNLLPDLSVTNLCEEKDHYDAHGVFSTYQTMMNCIDSVCDEEGKLFSCGHFDLLICDEEGTQPIGMWGRKHLRYIKENRPVLHTTLLLGGKLNSYLAEIDNRAAEMFERLMKQLTEQEGITEQLKAQDQMAWVGAMNSIRNQAEEIINAEIIYT